MRILKPCAAFVAMLLIGAGGSANAAVTIPQQVSADDINKSIVWVDVEFKGLVEVPFEEGSEIFTATSVSQCTGWFASDEGHVATAGHCLEPDQSTIQDLYTKVIAGNNIDIGELRIEDLEWRYELDEPVAYVGQPSGIEGGPLAGDNPIIAQVIEFQGFDNGDNALLKIANMSDTPALSVASVRPEVGDDIVAIGFAGSVSDVSDVSRQPPSHKEGDISSFSTSPRGVPNIEIGASVSGGMSGGPTVNEHGEVVGINSFGVAGETQAFNFITDTETMRTFLVRNGVELPEGQAPVANDPTSGSAVTDGSAPRGADTGSGTLQQPEESTSVVTVVLVTILVILLLAALAYAIFRVMKKRKKTTTGDQQPQPPQAS